MILTSIDENLQKKQYIFRIWGLFLHTEGNGRIKGGIEIYINEGRGHESLGVFF